MRRSRRRGTIITPNHCSHTICAKQGKRDYMEDRHCSVAPLPGALNSGCSFFGVYDGHGGDEAAEYCSKNLSEFLVRNSKLRENPGAALLKAYEKADKKFCAIANKKDIAAGTTAVSALVFTDKIVIANTGDSRAVIVRSGGATVITEDHNPGSPKETERIEALGGSVVNDDGCFRVEGVLGVSRAIGDYYLKPYVACTPDLYHLDRTKDDLFLVLASDGLWEDLEAKDCTLILSRALKKRQTIQSCATAMVDLALKKGSADNVCVVVVDLRNPSINKDISPAQSKTAKGNGTSKRKARGEDSPLKRTESTAGSTAIAAKLQEHVEKRQRRSRRSKKA